jgi:hypothetical protein
LTLRRTLYPKGFRRFFFHLARLLNDCKGDLIGEKTLLVIHIGTHKTGSTSLQLHLKRNFKFLLEQGVRYIEAGRIGNAHNKPAMALRAAGDRSDWALIREELAESRSRVNVLSAEAFWHTESASLREEIPRQQEVRIVVYLRRQDKFLQSLYKQAVTGGLKDDFYAWRQKNPMRGCYFSVIEQWAEQFGAESITIRPYERDGISDTTRDFLRVIGVEGELGRKASRHNPSPGRELLEFLRAFNQLGIDVDRREFYRALWKKNAAYTSSRDILSYQERVTLMESFAEENRLLVQKYYRNESSPLFPEMGNEEPPPDLRVGSEEFFGLTVDFLDVMAKFIAAPRSGLAEGDSREQPRGGKKQRQRSEPGSP